MGFHVVREGQRVAVWSVGGECELVDGPRLLFTVLKRVQRLQHHTADQFQYLVVSYIDGHRENVPGPCSLFFDPLQHRDITVRSGETLSANELLVVYEADSGLPAGRDNEMKVFKEGYEDDFRNRQLSSGQAERKIVRGPVTYVPKCNEWFHEFVWHGEDPNRKAHLVPGIQKFKKLELIPQSFYYNVRDVRTADDALLSVKVMIFYEISDLQRMLDQTSDPIADITNSCCADIVSSVSACDYIAFVESISKYNDLKTYPQLCERAHSIGITIQRVVYRGYHADENLQKMHDKAIESRTALRLEAEAEARGQEIRSLQLKGETDRLHAQMSMEKAKKQHENDLALLDHDRALAEERTWAEQKAASERNRNDEEIRKWREMANLGIDVTKVLVAPHQTASKVVRLESSTSSAPQPSLLVNA